MTLGKSIILLLIGILVGTALLIGSVAYFTTRSSVVSLRDSLMRQIDDGVQQKMQTYFDRVEPAIRFLDQAIFNHPNPLENWQEPATILAQYLKTEPEIIYLYYAERDTGHLLGALRDERGRYIVTRLHSDTGPLTRNFVIDDSGELAPAELPGVSNEPYDTRSRPWFLEAVRLEGLVWTRPYQFLNNGALGITAALARRDEEGKVLGVFAADLILDDLAMFLDDLEVGETGAAFLLLEDGQFPVPADSRTHPRNATLRAALNSQDWDLAGLKKGDSIVRRFVFESVSYVALIQPIALPGETRYFAGAIVPESDFLGVVWRNAWITVCLAFVILVVAAVLGIWLARRVTGPLAKIGEELEQIGHLEFREGGGDLRSSIREVSLFSDSVGKMKVSLRAFSRYVPRDLVRQLLSRGDEAQLGGCIEAVTVVFTDLAEFTRMSEGLTADAAFTELSDFLEIVANTQQRHGGITSSFTGDGTLALFNAPEPLDHHGLKACLAAWDCLHELRQLNERRLGEGKPAFKARIGINTADVLLGNLGTRERFAYTAIGDGVNLASRIEGLNKLYGTEILVSRSTRDAAGEFFEWRQIDSIAVVGRSQPTELYQPLGPAGEVEETLLKCRDLSEAALRLYFDGEFVQAENLFTQAFDLRPDDRASRVLAERCRSFAVSPPDHDWGGTYTAPFK